MALLALALVASCEIGLAVPWSAPLYLVYGGLLSAMLAWPPRRLTAFRCGLLALFAAGLLLLYLVPWNSRKAFLHDLHQIRPGMTQDEVAAIMASYLDDTTWPQCPPGLSPQTTTPRPAGPTTAIYRHSNSGRFNSDWGVVHFTEGRVTRVEFLPD